jgi:hypothetical protein
MTNTWSLHCASPVGMTILFGEEIHRFITETINPAEVQWDGRLGGGAQPLLHLFVADQARLLKDLAASGENDEVWDSADIETGCQFGMGLGVDFEHDCFSGHVLGGAGYFGRGRATGSTPGGPEVNQHRDGRVVDYFVEEGGIRRQGFGDRSKGGLASAASTCVGQMPAGDTVFLVAMSTASNDGQDEPLLLNICNVGCTIPTQFFRNSGLGGRRRPLPVIPGFDLLGRLRRRRQEELQGRGNQLPEHITQER